MVRSIRYLLISVFVIASGHLSAQSFPERPITLVVTFAPGGNIDLTARLIAPAMSAALGQQVIVNNRSGAGGTIGTQVVQRASPDGYTLLMGASNVSIAPFVYGNLSYDPVNDFVPIDGIQSVPLIVTASKASGITDWKTLVERARSAKSLSVATSGHGTSNHLALERIKLATALPLTHVPYRGSGPAISDLLGGQVDLMVDQLNSSLPMINDGLVTPVVQLGARRAPQLPNVPTLAEAGVPGITATTWVGLFAPAGTPAGVVDFIDAALRRALADPAVLRRFEELGVTRFEMTREQFAAFVRSDLAANKSIVERANVRSE